MADTPEDEKWWGDFVPPVTEADFEEFDTIPDDEETQFIFIEEVVQ